jgi:hypothetical protein
MDWCTSDMESQILYGAVLFAMRVSSCSLRAFSVLNDLDVVLLLPLVHLILLALVLFDQFIENLLQSIRIGLERRENVLDCPLNQDTVDQSKAFSILWERLQGLGDESDGADC